MKADYIALTQQSEIGSIRLSLKTEFARDCYARGKACARPRKMAIISTALHKKAFCSRRLRLRFSATSHFGKCGTQRSRSETAPTDFLCKALLAPARGRQG